MERNERFDRDSTYVEAITGGPDCLIVDVADETEVYIA